MSPIEMARTECANYEQGRCIGAAIDSGSCRPLEACLLHAKQRCGYFERCVLPLANRPGHMDWVEARRAYEKTHNLVARIEAKCSCGQVMEPGKRLCEACRQKHRRESTRDGMRKSRHVSNSEMPSD